MEISEFIDATTRLEKYYDKEYTKEQRLIMFDELKEKTIDRYKYLVSQAIKRCKFLPKVADFVQIDIESPEINNKKEIREKIECKKCKGTGYIVYKKKIDNGVNAFYNNYAAICDCGNAKVYNGQDYYTPTIAELGLKI